MFISFRNSFAEELPHLCKKTIPTSFSNAEILLKNYDLGQELGFNESFLDSSDCLSFFSGNAIPEGSIPISQAYSGHQFGPKYD